MPIEKAHSVLYPTCQPLHFFSKQKNGCLRGSLWVAVVFLPIDPPSTTFYYAEKARAKDDS